LTREEKERRKELEIKELIEKSANNSISFFNLDTSSIYTIY